MAPVYGSVRGAGNSGPWSMLRPGPRSALPRTLTWLPLEPRDNSELASLIARCEVADNPPYRTTEQETSEYFLDPTYSGVAGRDADGVMRAFGLVRVRPAEEIYASITGVVDPQWRSRGIGGALLHWQVERAQHLIGVQRMAASTNAVKAAHIVTTVLEDDARMKAHLSALEFTARRWYREMRRSLAQPIPYIEMDGFLRIEPWSEALDVAAYRAHNQAFGRGLAQGQMSLEEWQASRTYFAPQWSFVALDVSGDRQRVAGYLRSGRYEQDWLALGWSEGYTDMLGVLAEYRNRLVAAALLTTAMCAYKNDGMQYAATGVELDNPTGAVDLYRQLGYVHTRGSVLYGLDL